MQGCTAWFKVHWKEKKIKVLTFFLCSLFSLCMIVDTWNIHSCMVDHSQGKDRHSWMYYPIIRIASLIFSITGLWVGGVLRGYTFSIKRCLVHSTCVFSLSYSFEFTTAMTDRRLSINDIRLPPDLIKDYTVDALKELNNQDEGIFFEFFQGLDLEDVSILSLKFRPWVKSITSGCLVCALLFSWLSVCFTM